MTDFLDIVKNTTTSPGVYLMKNKKGEVIYVGKAKNLKKRLFSYFNKSPKTPKTTQLVKNIDKFDTIITSSEQEALLLEFSLIKQYSPKYNIRLKHSESYPYIAINVNSEAPYFQIKYQKKDPKYSYFGPYPQIHFAYEIVELLNKTFKLRTCKDNVYSHRSRPCLLFQIGQCSAPCTKEIELKKYKENVLEAISVLENKQSSFKKNITIEMNKAAKNQDFERAAVLRDQIVALDKIREKQAIYNNKNQDSKLFLNLVRDKNFYHIGVLKVDQGRVIDLQTYTFEDYDPEEDGSFYLLDFITQQKLSGEIVLPKDYDLSTYKVESLNISLRVAKGASEESLLSMISSNLVKNSTSEENYQELESVLELSKIPNLIECYDISHFQGSFMVGSKVSFLATQPNKDSYRKYKIKTISQVNDFAALEEVLTRRFSDHGDKFPEVIIIDGGILQVQVALRVLEKLNIQGVEVLGIAKDRTKSEFKSDTLETSGERIVFPDGREKKLEPRTFTYRLVTQLRNEAHRFALKYHRQLRSKNLLK